MVIGPSSLAPTGFFAGPTDKTTIVANLNAEVADLFAQITGLKEIIDDFWMQAVFG